MATEVVLTGTGVPHVHPDRAGAGTLIKAGEFRLQFDAGRATSMRLAQVGVKARDLDALFITHHHSDHLIGLVDLIFVRWLENHGSHVPLTVVAPEGPACTFVERMLDPWQDDINIRREHAERSDEPSPRLERFVAGKLVEVWQRDGVRVLARAVHHEPVSPAVAFRIETPDGVAVISGDTRVCEEIEELSQGADVLVHESFDRTRVEAFFDRIPHLKHIADYHADTREVGAMAARAGVGTLMLTHLIPAPTDAAGEQHLVDLIRAEGFDGELVVGRDCSSVSIGTEA
jgi:ribonuclease Z